MEGEKKAYQRTERRPGAELTPENKQLGQAKLKACRIQGEKHPYKNKVNSLTPSLLASRQVHLSNTCQFQGTIEEAMNTTNPTFTNLRLVAILENLQVANESTSLKRDVSPNHSRASADDHLTSSVF